MPPTGYGHCSTDPGRTGAALRAKDWSRTPLGPVETWSDELRAAIRTVLPSRIPMLLWWGPRLVQIFNDAYTPVLGDKYPDAIGQPGARVLGRGLGPAGTDGRGRAGGRRRHVRGEPAAVPAQARLPGGDVLDVLLQPGARRGRRDRRHLRGHHRRHPSGCWPTAGWRRCASWARSPRPPPRPRATRAAGPSRSSAAAAPTCRSRWPTCATTRDGEPVSSRPPALAGTEPVLDEVAAVLDDRSAVPCPDGLADRFTGYLPVGRVR